MMKQIERDLFTKKGHIRDCMQVDSFTVDSFQGLQSSLITGLKIMIF
jgi:hypothetical protein